MSDKEFTEVPLAPLKTVASQELEDEVIKELEMEDPVDKSTAQEIINNNTHEENK